MIFKIGLPVDDLFFFLDCCCVPQIVEVN